MASRRVNVVLAKESLMLTETQVQEIEARWKSQPNKKQVDYYYIGLLNLSYIHAT